VGKLQATLGKKIGPLPLGVWLLAIAGGLGLSFYMQRRSAEGEVTDEEVPYGDSFDPQPFPNAGGGIAFPDYAQPGPIAPTNPRPVTNDEWLMLGVEFLVSNGTNGLTAQNALSKYLEGKPLNETEKALVSRIIRAFGSPPEGAPSLEEPEVPTPGDPEPPTSTTPRWHSTTPTDVSTAFAAPSVAAVLQSLGIDWRTRGPSVLDKWDVMDGLKKLGWTAATDTSLTVRNVSRLMAKTKNVATGPPPNQIRFGTLVPSTVKSKFSAIMVRDRLRAIGTSPGYIISYADLRNGLKKLGYKKSANLSVNVTNVQRIVDKRKARKGE
jgi:hypothetical protein